MYTYGLTRVFDLASKANFDSIEILCDQRWDTRDVKYLRSLSDEFGLPVTSFHSPFLPVPGWPRSDSSRLLMTIKLALALDASVVVAHIPAKWQFARLSTEKFSFIPIPIPWITTKHFQSWLLHKIPIIEEQTGILVGVENMPVLKPLGIRMNPFSNNTLEGWKQYNHITLDTTHLATMNADPVQTLKLLGADKVVHVHLSNFNNGKQHRLPHNGEINLEEFLRTIRKNNYQGRITIELEPDSLGVPNLDQVKRNMYDSLSFCRNILSS